MKNIKYQSSILAGIYYLLTIILIILEYTFISIQKNEIVQQCQGSFQEALKKEKETFIIRKKFFYDVQKSSDNISADEKSNWCDQFFLLSEDPNRHRLDSIFRQKLVENNLPITGFITCTIGETYTIPTHTELIKKRSLSKKQRQESRYHTEGLHRLTYDNAHQPSLYLYSPCCMANMYNRSCHLF